MEEIYLRIDGKPIAKKTHRQAVKINWAKHDVRKWSYFPQAKEAEKVRQIIKAQYNGNPIDTALCVYFIFHLPMSPRWAARQKKMAKEGRILPIGRPDATNLAKFYEDCMNGIIYTDDAQIITPIPVKRYDDEAFTEIFITEFKWEDYQRFQGVVA